MLILMMNLDRVGIEEMKEIKYRFKVKRKEILRTYILLENIHKIHFFK